MKDNDTKELNLVQIIQLTFRWISSLLQKFVMFLGKLSQLSYKHWYIFLLFVALGVAGGFYFSQQSKLKYKAGTTLYVSYSKAFLVKDIIDKLKSSPANHKELSLAAKLNIPDSVADNILEMKYFNIIDYGKDDSQDLIDFKNQHSLADTMNVVMDDRIYLRVKTKNPNQISIFKDALLAYLNSNPRLIQEFEAKQQGHLEKVAFSEKEINRLDSLANTSYFKDKSYSTFNYEKDKLMIGEQKKPLFYEDVLNLIATKDYSQHYLNVAKTPVYMTDGFAVEGPTNPRAKLLVYGLLIGIAVGLIMSFVFEHLKTICKFLQNK